MNPKIVLCGGPGVASKKVGTAKIGSDGKPVFVGKIINPSCVSEAQDGWYGKNMRVYNPMKGGVKFRCSCCERVQDLGKAEPVKADKPAAEKKAA